MSFLFETRERDYRVAAVGDGDAVRIEIDGAWQDAHLEPDAENAAARWITLDGVRERVFVASQGDRYFVHLRGEHFEISRADPIARLREADAADGNQVLTAPMPGVVLELLVEQGSSVLPGDTLLVIESMKLQTSLVAQVAGRVTQLPLASGDSFDQGALLARIEGTAEEST